MSSFFQCRTWRVCRVCFRWFRIVCLLLVLGVVGLFIYLNHHGLPEWAKRRLLVELRARGVGFQYRVMRLEFNGGIVADEVTFVRAGEPESPKLSVQRVGLQLDEAALWHGRLAVESLSLRGGRFVVPLGATNSPAEFAVEGIEADLTFLPDDKWRVDNLRARCLGGRFQISGSMENASAVTNWSFGQPAGTNVVRDWREPLRDIAAAAQPMRFTVAPSIKGRLSADGLKPMQVLARLDMDAGGARTPWGDAQRFQLALESIPATNGGAIMGGTLNLHLADAQTPWGKAEDLKIETRAWPFDRAGKWRGLDFELHAVAPDTKWGKAGEVTVVSKASPQVEAGRVPGTSLDVRASGPDTPWGRAQSLHLTLTTAEMATNLAGMSAQLELDADAAVTPWGGAKTAAVSARITRRPADSVPATNAALGGWNLILPYDLVWRLRAGSVSTPQADAEKISASGQWRAPDLRVEKLEAELAGGKLSADAQLDVLTRALRAGAVADFDAKKLDRALGPATGKWLGQFGWAKPPVVVAHAGLTLPAWTNVQTDWPAEVVPTMWLRGALTNGAGSFRGIAFDRARLDFAFSNQVWHLTELVVDRPGGRIEAEHTSDEKAHAHWWRLAGDADIKAFQPLFNDEAVVRMLDDFRFAGPTHLEAELWDQNHAPESIGAKVRVRATNFTFRGETAGELTAALQFTNRNLQFRNVRLVRTDGEVTVPSGSFDFVTECVHLTNVVGNIDAFAALRPIGPETVRTMEPYQFGKPPRVTVDGVIPVHDITKVDLRFTVDGGPFHWQRFNLPAVKADVHWHDNGLDLTNLTGVFYDGKVTGHAHLDFSHPAGTSFSFAGDVWESDLKKLLTDVNNSSNRVEGVLNGQVIITYGNTWDMNSWQGHGRAELRDGLLWDSPMFGFLSLPLNMIAPGLGNSRARAATATFVMTNSVIRADDLDVFTAAARLKYRGTVDFDTRVNARLEAELLRDSPLVGKMFSLLFAPLTKIFEYKVTGTLANPKPEPLYFLPRLLLMPFSPVKTLKDLFGEEEKKPESGNPAPAPAVPAPVPVPKP